ncbi:putative serine/threonine protein kinase [Blattamonas nauphoetae]|uniref:Serine/threonine protein kinase n=1 Tax=Blattamonas nauphoetae TaxID=2049346 RepID=A0ABQ9X668_9EUKA|nr:putative serine/threonine protein kinase [Blattamonas nauphoetae]
MFSRRKEQHMKDYEVERTVNEHHGVTLLKVVDRRDGEDLAIHSCPVEPENQTSTFEALMFTYYRFNSPFILNVIDWFEDEKSYWIVRQWSDKPSLRMHVADLWKKQSQIKENSIWDIVSTCGLAIYYLHMNGVVHRHLTLDNIFVESSILARIGDFNLYRWFEEPEKMGPFFMSAMAPELFQDSPTFSPKSDMWSFGCILYEIVMQKPPFHSDDSEELKRQIEEDDPQPLPRWISPDLSTLIYSLLNKDPMERPNVENFMQLPKAQERLEKIVPKLFPQMGMLLREQKSYVLQLEQIVKEQKKYEEMHSAFKADPTLEFPMPPYPPEWQKKRDRELERQRQERRKKREEQKRKEHEERKKAEAEKKAQEARDRGEEPIAEQAEGVQLETKNETGDKEAAPAEATQEEPANPDLTVIKDEAPPVEEESKIATEQDLHEAVRHLMKMDYIVRSKLPRLTTSQMCAITLWRGVNVLLTRVRDIPGMGLRKNIRPIIPEGAKIRIEGNRLSMKQKKPIYMKLDPPIREGIWRLDMGYVASADNRWFGFCEADFEFPENYDPGQDEHTAAYTGHTGGVWHNGKWRVGNRIWHDSDVVSIEINYEVTPPTAHFLAVDLYQPISFVGIPPSVRFFFNLQESGTTVELLCLSRPYSQHLPDLDDAAQLQWGNEIPTRIPKKSKKWEVEVKDDPKPIEKSEEKKKPKENKTKEEKNEGRDTKRDEEKEEKKEGQKTDRKSSKQEKKSSTEDNGNTPSKSKSKKGLTPRGKKDT